MLAKKDPGGPRPILFLYDERDFAASLNMSVRQLERKVKSGEVPPPDVRLDARPRWSRYVIKEWVKAGCPKTPVKDPKSEPLRQTQRLS